MVDILHRVGIATSSPDEVYRALSTRDGLAAWWTEDTQGVSAVGDVLQFRFPQGGFDMRVEALTRPAASGGRSSTGRRNGSARR